MATKENDAKTDLIGRASTVAFAGIEIVVVEGPDRGLRREIKPGKARVGTGPSSDVRLNDPTVSRLHCDLQIQGEGLRVIDSESTNGTFVDGVRIFDALLTTDATLRVGSTSLRVEFGDEPIYVQISSSDHFGELLGQSVDMRRLFTILERAAATDATVLIQGETGTGKELVARALHEQSKRAQSTFIAVDCGAIAENLIESELFGHVRGAFTGALRDRVGLFEQARGGTIFLDEIGELPISLQPKLLRALEAREIRPVGANAPRPVDIRVLAATNRDLARRVNEGTFREDLYYRLAVVEVVLPPLRARRDDIPVLAAKFFERFSGPGQVLPSAWIPSLVGRGWPGNVRELRNFIERSVSLGFPSREAPSHGATRGQSLPPGAEALVPTEIPLKEARAAWADQFEEVYVRALLRRTDGNVTRAAELAGVNRRTLQRLIADLGLRSLVGQDDGGA